MLPFHDGDINTWVCLTSGLLHIADSDDDVVEETRPRGTERVEESVLRKVCVVEPHTNKFRLKQRRLQTWKHRAVKCYSKNMCTLVGPHVWYGQGFRLNRLQFQRNYKKNPHTYMYPVDV